MELETGSVVEETTEVAEPEQEAAAPAENTEVESETGENGTADPEIPNDVWKKARERAEAEARKQVAKQLQERDMQFAERFKDVKNPVTGQPIRSEADYFAALDAQRQMRMRNQLQEKGVDPKIIEEAVNSSPAVIAATKVLQQMQQSEGDRKFNEQFAEIQKLDRDVTDIGALKNSENFEVFNGYVLSGMDMVSAYKLANFDKLANQKAKAAQQSTINAAKGKSHMNPVSGDAGESTDLSEADIAEYEKYGFSRKDAIKYHNQFKKEK